MKNENFTRGTRYTIIISQKWRIVLFSILDENKDGRRVDIKYEKSDRYRPVAFFIKQKQTSKNVFQLTGIIPDIKKITYMIRNYKLEFMVYIVRLFYFLFIKQIKIVIAT